MNIRPYFKALEKFTADNSPLILTALGAAGVLTTAILAAKGGMEASVRLAAEEERRKWRQDDDTKVYIPEPEAISIRDKVVLTWSCYAPACGVGLITVGAIVASNRISTKRAAALAAAFSLTNEAFDEYKDKIKEKLGERKEQNARDELAKDRVNENPPTDENVIVVTHNSDALFQDSWSGRYFRSNTENVRQAVNELNHVVNTEGSATLSEFYELMGLSKTRESDEVGWNSDKLLDVYFAAVLHDNGKEPVMAIEYRVTPTRSFFRTR